ncbi:MAG: ComEC/Rec2 family competence protein [Clostridia bacterium]|nr:ComEC/Rec2 family competence protein [Clostridia bacterium]
MDSIGYATDRGSEMTIRLRDIGGTSFSAMITMQCEHAVYADPGEIISCRVEIQDDRETQDFSERLYRFSHGVIGSAVYSGEKLEAEGRKKTIGVFFSDIREQCEIRMRRYLSGESTSLLSALVLGDRSAVDPMVKRDFRRIGISHMLAVSGMHLSILLMWAERLMPRTKLHKRWRVLLEMILIFAAIGITGFSPSVCRAGIMWIIYLLSYYLAGTKDAYTALFAAMAGICLVRPYAAVDTGLLMSVSAVFGIQYLGIPAEERIRAHLPKRPIFRFLRDYILAPLTITLSATLFVLPITAALYGEISIWSPLANILMNPPVSGLLMITPLLLLMSFVPGLQLLAPIPAAIAELLSRLCLWLAHILSGLGRPLISLWYPFFWPIAVLAAVLGVVLVVRRRNRLHLFTAAFAGFLLFGLCIPVNTMLSRGSAQVYYHTRGTNDSMAVLTDERAVMIDLSDGAFNIVYEMWEELHRAHVTEISCYVLTHYHEKHISQLYRLSSRTWIETVYLPEPADAEEEQLCRAMMEDPALRGLHFALYRRGQEELLIGSTAVTVFPTEKLSRAVRPLLGVTVTLGKETVTYVSASAWDAEDDLAQTDYADYRDRALADTDVLICGVHGPKVKNAFGARSSDMPYDTVITANSETEALFSGQAVHILHAADNPYLTVLLSK